ncbi:MAG: two-component system response regulator [Actinomycetota bacterium]
MDLNFSQVRALVAEANPMVRQGVRNALYGMGFRDIIDTGMITKAQEVCATGGADLLVINSDLEGNDSSLLVREMRRMKVGNDPFVVVMSILPVADEPHVRKVVDCGVDDMLLMPFSPDQMRTRMQTIISRRKPFVVTHDYIGPDRRKAPRPGTANANQLPVPNPVVARGSGVAPDRYKAMVEQATGTIRSQRVHSLAGYIRREGVELFAIGRDGQPLPDDLAYRMFRLETILDELMEFSGNALDLRDFQRVCSDIKNAGSRTGFRELEALYQHTTALSARFGVSSAA